MPQSQPQVPDVTLVADATLGKSVPMPTIDAISAIRNFPARYSFAVSDPRTLPPTVNPQFAESGGLAKPAITGAKGGNAALASVITALVALGLASDTST
jgi:hypothetical protein